MFTEKLKIEDFLELSRSNPILDVRTPSEFEIGHIPGAHNFPLFSDDERRTIGTIYKKEGHFKAILLGLDLVKDRLAEMVKDAVKYNSGDAIMVHCWRGGLRSESIAWLLSTARIKTYVLEGGYKSYRNFALDYFCRNLNIAILSGATGTGKTEILKYLKEKGEQVIDLENLALHKGSVFGGIGQKAQPTSEHFQNLLYNEISDLDPQRIIWLEDENPVIGKVAIPEGLWKQMVKAPRVRIMAEKENRINRIVAEYAGQDFKQLCKGIAMLEKRLGNKAMNDAITNLQSGNPEIAVDILLTYYDKAYENSFQKKKETEWFSIEMKSQNISSIGDEIIGKTRELKLQKHG